MFIFQVYPKDEHGRVNHPTQCVYATKELALYDAETDYPTTGTSDAAYEIRERWMVTDQNTEWRKLESEK